MSKNTFYIKDIETDEAIEISEFVEKFDLNKRKLSELKSFEYSVLTNIAYVAFHHLIQGLMNQEAQKKIDIARIKSIDEMCENVQKMKQGLERAVAFTTKTIEDRKKKPVFKTSIFKKDFVNTESSIALSEDALQEYKYCLDVLNKSIPLFKNLSTAEKITNCEYSTKREFLKNLLKINKKIIASMEELEKLEVSGDEFKMLSPEVMVYHKDGFILLTDMLDPKNLAEETKVEPRKVNQATESQEEKERKALVSKANSMYFELKLDWVRDLESQAPYSVKDQVNAFMDKLARFEKSFAFPLSSDTPSNTAKEAISQIQNLMNKVSEISSQSYVSWNPEESEPQ